LPPDWIGPIVKAASGGLEPDIVVLMDVDPALARARRKAHKLRTGDTLPPSRKGLMGVGIQHRMRRGYLELAERDLDRWIVIDNERPLDATAERVTELIVTAVRENARLAIERDRACVAAAGESASVRGALRSADDALRAFLRWIDVHAEHEPAAAAYLLSGLFGPPVDERRLALAARAPEVVVAGSSGCADPTSWQLRQTLAGEHPGLVARSLRGVGNHDPRALELRLELEARVPVDVAESLAGLDDGEAWAARDRLFGQAPAEVAASLWGLGSDRAWELRERWLVGTQGRSAEDPETARTAARSVGELDDERAWAVRDGARVAAPIAALSSVLGLVSPRSWEWRTSRLGRAAKVVMGTLRSVSHDRAWEMRRAVVADCKEAIDSIADLDDPEAWELREEYADIWPSTVVKSLGTTADEPRGARLLERQLASHADKISLLKHASAIALGLHRMPRPSERPRDA
jgi:dTMP kinase